MARDRLRAIPSTLARSWPGRFLLAGAAAKILLFPFVTDGGPLLAWVDGAASVALVVGLGHPLLRFVSRLRRRMLWRVRSRLFVSYVFGGVVPVLLVILFFAVAGVMSGFSARSVVVNREVDRVVADARVAAAAVGARLASGMEAAAALEPLPAALRSDYPGVSALVIGPTAGGAAAAVGPWNGGSRPDRLPEWVRGKEFAGLVTVGPRRRLAVRAVAQVNGPRVGAVVVDVPLDAAVQERMEAAAGVELEPLGALADDAARPGPAPRPAEPLGALADDALDPSRLADGLAGVVSLEPVDWATGAARAGNQFTMRVPAAAFLDPFFGTGEPSVRNPLLMLLGVLGALFLVILLAASFQGFALARAITGAIHDLSVGAGRIRRRDFSWRVSVASDDQLGELAESFNAMTAEMEGLLHQAAEKRRLDDELRLARQIQMSLLPRDPTSIPGLSVTAVCRPAREVGGDYYDFVRLGERRLGLLVADVSGKGTSAALYMAELKGLVLSLGPTCESPRQLLLEVNRILAGALDARSFITMLYAVVDLDAGTLTCARAGHTPLLYASQRGARREVTVLAPNGFVLGLHGVERRFDELLEEHQIPVRPGDVAVLFTDGVTEAMNEDDDLFGEARLARLLEDDEAATSETLHERIVREVDAFVGTADQHDDMTMVLLRVDEAGAATEPRAPAAAVVEPGAPS